MRDTLSICVTTFILLLSACGDVQPMAAMDRVTIEPDEFALRPCAPVHQEPCNLVVAGGKRILFGVPAGVTHSQSTADLRQLDAVVVFSLTAKDLEGVDEVRNRSWHAGRAEPLWWLGRLGLKRS